MTKFRILSSPVNPTSGRVPRQRTIDKFGQAVLSKTRDRAFELWVRNKVRRRLGLGGLAAIVRNKLNYSLLPCAGSVTTGEESRES